MLRSATFNDFRSLILQGSQTFISYGHFVEKYPNAPKKLRQKMIAYHYSNYKTNYQ